MKKYLSIVVLLTIISNAQINKKNFFIKKELYHHSFQDLKMIFSVDECRYDEEYKKVLLCQTKALDKEKKYGELYVQFKETFKYDDKDRIIEKEREELFQNNFRKDDKITYTYDDNGNIKESIELNWNPDLNKYEKLEKHNYTYNSKGEMLTDKWTRANNNDTWRELFVDTYNYSEGLLRSVTRQYVENVEGGAYLQRTLYSYDEKGKRIKELVEKFSNNKWETYSKYEITYDNNDNVTTKISHLYIDGKWVPNFRFEPTKYNTDYLTKETYSPERTLGLFPSKNVVTAYNVYQYDLRLQKWKQITRDNLTYDFNVRDEVIDIPENPNPNVKEKEGINIYPNPTFKFFSISTDETDGTVEVHDLAGRRIKSFPYLRDSYDVSSLTPGIYIVVLKTNNIQKEFKLIKK